MQFLSNPSYTEFVERQVNSLILTKKRRESLKILSHSTAQGRRGGTPNAIYFFIRDILPGLGIGIGIGIGVAIAVGIAVGFFDVSATVFDVIFTLKSYIDTDCDCDTDTDTDTDLTVKYVP